MLFDFNASMVKQNQQKEVILERLNEIAQQPITASPKQRDNLQEQLIQFIYQTPFDSLYGGLVLRDKSHNKTSLAYFKPKETNKILSEIFRLADQVFYHGLFSYMAKQIDGYLTGTEQKCLSLDKLPAFFTNEVLNHQLDDKERQLLNSLVSQHKYQSDLQGLFISYSRSLKDAALAINMHDKEAQIIEFSIQSKLKSVDK